MASHDDSNINIHTDITVLFTQDWFLHHRVYSSEQHDQTDTRCTYIRGR